MKKKLNTYLLVRLGYSANEISAMDYSTMKRIVKDTYFKFRQNDGSILNYLDDNELDVRVSNSKFQSFVRNGESRNQVEEFLKEKHEQKKT